MTLLPAFGKKFYWRGRWALCALVFLIGVAFRNKDYHIESGLRLVSPARERPLYGVANRPIYLDTASLLCQEECLADIVSAKCCAVLLHPADDNWLHDDIKVGVPSLRIK